MVKNASLLSLVLFSSPFLSAEILKLTDADRDVVVKRSASKPMIIDFYADWCGPCKQMAPMFEKLEKELSEDYTFAKVNVDECKELSLEYGITAMPTCVVVKGGQPLGKIQGFMDEQAFKAKIDEIIHPKDLKKLSDQEKHDKLLEALMQRDIDQVKKLIDAGVDLNKNFENGYPPLLLVLYMGPQSFGPQLKEVISILVAGGADLSVDTPKGPMAMRNVVKETITSLKQLATMYEDIESYFAELETKKNNKDDQERAA